MNYGLIGEHLPHSFSAEIHGEIGRFTSNEYEYEIKELKPSEVDGFMLKKDFKGINVTIPYKETVIPYLDHIDEAAKEIGAVNTIVGRDGKLFGYNTDFYGLKDLILHAGIDLKGKKVLILGTGGTSKTARYVCKDLGAGKIIVVSRNHKNAEATGSGNGLINTGDKGIAGDHLPDLAIYTDYDEVYLKHTDADVIINTTPVGMYPNDGKTAIDPDRFDRLTGVIDVIYNPLKTAFIRRAEKRNIKCAGGLRMLVTQAVYAYCLFMDIPLSDKENVTGFTGINDGDSKSALSARSDESIEKIVENVYAKIRANKQNIVLIGMPGCGKTTVGRRLADKYGKEFIDTDEMIVNNEGRQITDIFASDGEEYFRDLESEAIALASSKGGRVIATGGGAILRNKNVDALRSNGLLIFLDRPLNDLLPTADRPLASDREMIKKRYEERYDIYRSVCDIRVTDTDETEGRYEQYMANAVG